MQRHFIFLLGASKPFQRLWSRLKVEAAVCRTTARGALNIPVGWTHRLKPVNHTAHLSIVVMSMSVFANITGYELFTFSRIPFLSFLKNK